MKRIILGILLGLMLSAGIFLIDLILNTRKKISPKTAFITLQNESDYRIKRVTLIHAHGELSISNVDIGKTAYLGFPNQSENSYNLTVELENDSTLSSGGYYFEYGLIATETITNKEIITENNW